MNANQIGYIADPFEFHESALFVFFSECPFFTIVLLQDAKCGSFAHMKT